MQNRRVNDLYDNTLRQLQPETRSIIEFSKRVNLTGALNYREGVGRELSLGRESRWIHEVLASAGRQDFQTRGLVVRAIAR